MDTLLEEIGGGKLTIRPGHGPSKVFVDFSDTRPGVDSPGRVFNVATFTTKPVGKGTGLGLSICYGISNNFFFLHLLVQVGLAKDPSPTPQRRGHRRLV